jgi:hypothetical protein
MVVVLGGSTEDMVEQYLLSQCFTVGIDDGVRRFAPTDMVVERGNATGALGLLQILTSHSQFHYIVLCIRLVKVAVMHRPAREVTKNPKAADTGNIAEQGRGSNTSLLSPNRLARSGTPF